MPTNALPSLVHAIGGAIGSALSILAFYPLERIRVELQSHSCVHVTAAAPVGDDDLIDGVGDAIGYGKDVNDSSQSLKRMEEEKEINVDVDEHESFEIVHYPENAPVKPFSQSLSSEVSSPEKAVKIFKNVHFEADKSTRKMESEPSIKKSTRASQNSNKCNSESMLDCLLRLRDEKSLYKGASHMAITLMISNFIFFYALHLTKQSLTYIHQQQQQRQHQKRPGQNHSEKQKLQLIHHIIQNYLHLFVPKSQFLTSLLSSSVAGVINVLLTNPLWVASLRIMESKVPMHLTKENNEQCNHKTTLWSVLHDIAHSEGVSQLWSGTWTSLLLVSNPIIQHFIYEQMRSWLLGRRHGSRMKGQAVRGTGRQHRGKEVNTLQLLTLTPLEAFVFGALAKTVATVTTYPLQLAQVLLRLQTKQISCRSNSNADHNNLAIKEPTYAGTMDCLCQQFARGGMPALFHGMNAKLLQTVLTSALTFLTYEQTLVLVGRVYDALR